MKYLKQSLDESFKFKAAKSSAAVTTHVTLASIGALTVIDTPGTNDPNKLRTDQVIY